MSERQAVAMGSGAVSGGNIWLKMREDSHTRVDEPLALDGMAMFGIDLGLDGVYGVIGLNVDGEEFLLQGFDCNLGHGASVRVWAICASVACSKAYALLPPSAGCHNHG